MKKKEEVINEQVQNEPMIYVGPTIKNVATQYTVFTNGITNILKEKIEKVPEIGKLIIPVSRLQEVKKKIMTKGTTYNIYYSKVMEIEGGK